MIPRGRLGGLRLAAVAAAALLLIGAAADPGERLKDPAQEAQARQLFRQFRCVVCQNESIDDSDAELAHDLRQLIRQQVAQGRSDAQIRAFLVERYGEFILLKPQFSLGNAVLWLSPVLIVLAGGALFARRLGRPVALEPELSTAEEMKVRALVGSGGIDTVTPNNGVKDDAAVDER
jgi:cytochrome c-type biogenesis protein CcmH